MRKREMNMKFILTLLSILVLAIGITASSALAANRALSLDGYGDYVKIPAPTDVAAESATGENGIKITWKA